MSDEIGANIQWSNELEAYFKSTAEKAHGLAYLHKKAEVACGQKRNWIDLPVIIISGVTGFLSAGSTTMFDDAKTSSVALGVASLFVSILNTAGSYFAYAKRAEGHRISAIQYNRLYRFLSVELSLPRHERMSPHDLLKHTKDAIDRLDEVSPVLPPAVIREFQKKFEKVKDISIPEECNGLEKVVIYTDNPLRREDSVVTA